MVTMMTCVPKEASRTYFSNMIRCILAAIPSCNRFILPTLFQRHFAFQGFKFSPHHVSKPTETGAAHPDKYFFDAAAPLRKVHPSDEGPPTHRFRRFPRHDSTVGLLCHRRLQLLHQRSGMSL